MPRGSKISLENLNKSMDATYIKILNYLARRKNEFIPIAELADKTKKAYSVKANNLYQAVSDRINKLYSLGIVEKKTVVFERGRRKTFARLTTQILNELLANYNIRFDCD